jgi:hypothetical protein
VTDLERTVARAIDPNTVAQAPEARRAILAVAAALREHDEAGDGRFGVYTIAAHWLVSQLTTR